MPIARTSKSSKRRPPSLRKRASSLELGDRSTRYNKQTGRPIRDGAGKKQQDPEYVDSVIIEDDMPVETCSEDDEGNPRQPKRVTKRKRSPSPTPPPLSPIIYDEMSSSDPEVEDLGISAGAETNRALTLHFDIAPGFQGPLVVELDPAQLIYVGKCSDAKHNTENVPSIWRGGRRRKTKVTAPKINRRPSNDSQQLRIGFMSLPPELRNKVYRLLFVASRELNFVSPDNFCLSSAFLRTCRQVHDEGTSILYGENSFHFERHWRMRAPFWDPVPKEIGFKDMRLFLKMIGTVNLARIRTMRIIFEDAKPSSAPYLNSQEERRFVHDEHLLDCLRLLRQSELKKLTLCFHGRKTMTATDAKFLEALGQIQADKVEIIPNPKWYYMEPKIHYTLKRPLIELMTRNPPLHTVQ
ncbi:hypothetical protein K432DRAFT_383284 [Lepidopterella palustris CBS 459.81]|uniref:Uncharacterized protein n=1 Tax=Lepidopterella palustris CBS 459.81 TaxID=1314670 RepID=A0A8E2E891_9PEZI|nr:hypothetical protein K432DRAFT_383284 [Lepidopterella palustris CBS 459.81]